SGLCACSLAASPARGLAVLPAVSLCSIKQRERRLQSRVGSQLSKSVAERCQLLILQWEAHLAQAPHQDLDLLLDQC
ncbi:hypothetical protein chiPu_0019730, partial [Chiloscyllium punctatum]|nr:hypothetical protein [Chiloscyllium punctatum]